CAICGYSVSVSCVEQGSGLRWNLDPVSPIHRTICSSIAIGGQMRAKIRGTEIFFDVDGAGLVPDGDKMVERPVLFLLHGGPGGDHAGFKTSSAALRDVAQLVYVDHRGCGRSSPGDAADYTLDNNIDDLDALREYLGLARISILGSSYGGM